MYANIRMTRQMALVRQEQLKAMLDNVITNALSHGYPAEEIKETFIVELARWVRQRQPTDSSHPRDWQDPR